MKVYDCFTFFNELDLLELRLDLLAPYVDHFVLVECVKNHHGEEKPLFFAENRSRYAKYEDKIIYVRVTDPPIYQGGTDMGIVNFLRNSIIRGLADYCRPEDYVLVSDLDEIPNPEILKHLPEIRVDLCSRTGSWKQRMRERFRSLAMYSGDFLEQRRKQGKFRVDDMLNYTPVGLEYSLFYYYMNCRSRGKWYGAYVAKYGHMMMPHEPRELAYQRQLPVVRNAGWHFSYLGGVEAVREKLAAVSDGNPEVEAAIHQAGSNEAYIKECLEKGVDIIGRKGRMFEYEFIHPEEIGIPEVANVMEQYPGFFRKEGE